MHTFQNLRIVALGGPARLMMNSQCSKHYTFHGLGITIRSDPAMSAALHSRLRQFTAHGHNSPDLAFNVSRVSHEAAQLIEPPQAKARPVYKSCSVEILYAECEDQLYIDCKYRIKVLCDPERGQTQISMPESEEERQWFISHPLFTVPFIESLKRRGLYSLHAAGLCVGDKGLLIAGTSGAGKTTLTIALLRAGFDYMGDDTIFLTERSGDLRALAFPDEIDITDRTAELFPELRHLLDIPKPPGWTKRQVQAEQVYGVGFVTECKPVVIIFPKVVNAEKSVIKPMTRDEALLNLVPNVLLTEAKSSQAHLNVIGRLVRETEFYRLETGRDLDTLPLLLRDLVK
jgi:hypothetical protein